jgi:hypothetical protein
MRNGLSLIKLARMNARRAQACTKPIEGAFGS